MKSVHPAFDTATCTWFVEEPAAEARSLARLQRMLPDYQLIGYEPNGHKPTRWPTMQETERAMLPEAVIVSAAAPHSPEFKSRVDRSDKPPKKYGHRQGADRKYDHDAILNLWSIGLKATEIAIRLNMPAPSVTGIVADYRRRKDPRAATRYRT
jgi:hypothetical protein